MAKRGRKPKYEQKTVVRKYISKKTGKEVIKTYTYGREVYKPKTNKRKYSQRLTSKTGRTYKKFETFVESRESIAEQQILKNIARDYIKKGKILTETRAIYELSREKILSALDNTGYSLEEIASQINTDVNDLVNPNNWNGSIYTDPQTGKRYEYHWSYYDDVLVEVA